MTGIKWLLAAVFVGWVLLSAVVALQDEPADSMGGISGDSVGAAIYGVWSVAQLTGMSLDRESVGSLTISEGAYEFVPSDASRSLDDLPETLAFFSETPRGNIEVEYWTRIDESDLTRDQERHDILATVTFSGPSFKQSLLVRWDDCDELYLHATVSEFSLWSITKGMAESSY